MTATISPVQEPSSLQAVAPAKTAPKPECVCSLALPQRRLWTRAEFERIADAGVFGPEERLELIEGEITVKVPQNTPHATAIILALRALFTLFATGFQVRVQLPFIAGDGSLIEPDFAIVAGEDRDALQGHPTTAVLAVEVSDSTLVSDRTIKAGLYARAGVLEYWIINLVDRTLEVHRQPAPMSERPLGHYYRSVVQYMAEETVSPLAAPEHTVAVAALLP
jgi:Uma2 family endonuclease